MKIKRKAIILVKRYREKFKFSESQVKKTREEWDKLDKRLKKVFNIVIGEHENDNYYTYLSTQDEDSCQFPENKVRNSRHTAIKFGKKPMDISEIEFDPATQRPKRIKRIFEKGGALFFNQGINGDVAVYMFPSRNDIFEVKDNLLLLKIYNKPSDISERKIIKHIDQFFWFTLTTSYLSGYSSYDRIKLTLYKIRSKTLKINWVLLISILIFIVSTFSLIINLTR